jgi:hypothetical protein
VILLAAGPEDRRKWHRRVVVGGRPRRSGLRRHAAGDARARLGSGGAIFFVGLCWRLGENKVCR